MVQSLDKVPLANQISLDDTVMNNTDKLGISPPTPPPRKSTARQPRLLPRNVCLFCYNPEIKPHYYKRTDHLRKHYQRVHFPYILGSSWCPVLGCNTIIDSPDRFCNHAKTVHRSDLGVRASIMNANAHRTRPGQLQAFRLG